MKEKKIEDRGSRIAKEPQAAHAARAILYLLSSVFCLAPAGCMVVGALTHKVVGSPAVPAQYLPAKEPMLILVENYTNPAAVRLDAQRLSVHLSDELRRYHVAPVVDADAVETLRARPDYASMKVEEVGQAAGAAQVLYINLKQFT